MITTRDRDEFLIATVIKLIKRRAIPNLNNVIEKTHAADIARWFPRCRPEEKTLLFDLLVRARKMREVLPELNSEDRLLFIDSVEPPILADIFTSVPPDEITDILADLPEERQAEILTLIKGKASEDVQQLLQYEEKTAGAIMNPQFFALPIDTTAAEATEQIRSMADVEMVFYVYATDEDGRLEGVISLRQLVTTPPQTPIRDLMTRRVYKVHPTTPQEEAARVVSRYNILAVPVVDEEDILVGIITIDDVVDVIREENTEDMLRMAGASDVDLASMSVMKSAKARLPWLFASWCGGVIAAGVIGAFEGQLEQMAALTAFIPIIMGMGGNIGTQSSTIIVRGMATGEVNLKEWWPVLWRELATGGALGVIYGVLLGGFAKFRYWTTDAGDPQFIRLPVVVMVAIALNMTLAATLGTLIPMVFKRIRVDPAVATGPFVTTAIDILGIGSYFLIAKAALFS